MRTRAPFIRIPGLQPLFKCHFAGFPGGNGCHHFLVSFIWGLAADGPMDYLAGYGVNASNELGLVSAIAAPADTALVIRRVRERLKSVLKVKNTADQRDTQAELFALIAIAGG